MPEHTESIDCKCIGCIHEWMVRSRARDSLSLLVRPIQRFEFVEIGDRPPEEYPLAVQLRDASLNSSGSSSVGRSRAGVPFDVVASEMLSALEHELHSDAVLLLARPASSVANVVADGEALLARVNDLEGEVLERPSENWAGWVQRIKEHLNPARRTPLDGQCPNPECQSDRWVGYDEEGGRLVEPALYAIWENERIQAVECVCCFSSWSRAELWNLSHWMGKEDFKKALQFYG